ncbi:aurora kinase A- and ninein-interacting protein [Ambystoma mexicanum]|uniref:aurora kinase A- and ninein-interacting protein n=1 Tax=Ambystoma mexicanum TaxID=8296 RepID=UPI0037E7D6AE
MKTKGNRVTSPLPEACGVWLDTSAGKKRGVQTLISRPSFKLRDLFPRRAASATVEYGFTQSRDPQLCTLQTTISSFFTTTPSVQVLDNPETAFNKRKQTANPLTSTKKSRATEPCPALQQGDDWSDLKPQENLLCEPLTEASPNVLNAVSESSTKSVTPQTSDAPIKAECLPSEDSSLLGESKGNLQCSGHLKTMQSLPFYNLNQPTTRDFSGFTLHETPRASLHACTSPSDQVGKTETQIDFTQDSEGNMVLAHRTEYNACHPLQKNRAECWQYGGASATTITKENRTTKGCTNKCLAKAPERKTLQYCEPCENYLSNTQNLVPAEISSTKANCMCLVKCIQDKQKLHDAKSLHLGHLASGLAVGSPNKGTRISPVKKDTGPGLVDIHLGTPRHLSSRLPKDHLKTSVQRTPLGDKTNEIKEVKRDHRESSCRSIFSSTLYSDSGNCSPVVEPLPGMLFTQDSEGNTVIKH